MISKQHIYEIKRNKIELIEGDDRDCEIKCMYAMHVN